MEDEVVRRGFRVVGRVQGVGFRWWTRRQGESLGLAGVVWNRADGSVEVQVQGPAQAVKTLERRLADGPPAARVEAVAPVAPAGEVPDGQFRIVR